MTHTPAKPLPDTTDPRIQPYLRAAKEGRVSVQRCSSCGYLRWPPSMRCPECLADCSAWIDVAPRGTVWSVAVYHHAYAPAFADDVPYQVALVELESGPFMIGRVTSPLSEGVRVADSVEAVFEPISDDVTLVMFRPSNRATPRVKTYC